MLFRSPFHYNAAKRRLTVWQKVTARVHSPDADAEAAPRFLPEGAVLTNYQASQIRSLVENAEQVLKSATVTTTPRLLVVTSRDLLDKAQELARIGRLSNYTLTFLTIDQPADSASLYALIKQEYMRGNLDGVLLFGDEVKVPLYYWTRSEEHTS